MPSCLPCEAKPSVLGPSLSVIRSYARLRLVVSQPRGMQLHFCLALLGELRGRYQREGRGCGEVGFKFQPELAFGHLVRRVHRGTVPQGIDERATWHLGLVLLVAVSGVQA